METNPVGPSHWDLLRGSRVTRGHLAVRSRPHRARAAIGLDVNTASSDYIQLYDGDRKTLIASLERIQRTAGETLEAVTDESAKVAAVMAA